MSVTSARTSGPSLVAKREQPVWRQRLQRAYNRRSTTRSLAALKRSSGNWRIVEPHRRPAVRKAWTSGRCIALGCTPCAGPVAEDDVESINALILRSAVRSRSLAELESTPSLAGHCSDIEPRLRKVMGYRHLPRLRDALKRELKIDRDAEEESRQSGAAESFPRNLTRAASLVRRSRAVPASAVQTISRGFACLAPARIVM